MKLTQPLNLNFETLDPKKASGEVEQTAHITDSGVESSLLDALEKKEAQARRLSEKYRLLKREMDEEQRKRMDLELRMEMLRSRLNILDTAQKIDKSTGQK